MPICPAACGVLVMRPLSAVHDQTATSGVLCRAQLAVHFELSPGTPPAIKAHGHDADVVPFLQRPNRSAFESEHGTQYSISSGERASNESTEPPHMPSWWSLGGEAGVASPPVLIGTQWNGPDSNSNSNVPAMPASDMPILREADSELSSVLDGGGSKRPVLESMLTETGHGGSITFQQVRRRLEEAHAQGLLHDGTEDALDGAARGP
jgi:hypothetical protein